MPTKLNLYVLPLLATVAMLASCDSTGTVFVAPEAAVHTAAPARAHGDLFRAVRQESSRFNSTTQAARAGYAQHSPCIAHPELGGMGFHWIAMELIDGTFDPLRPEALLYEPGPGNNLRLVGVEYIVIAPEGAPLDGPARPHFDGHPFDLMGVPFLVDGEGEPIPHWSLHVWTHRDNPSGTFAPFNPNVRCH